MPAPAPSGADGRRPQRRARRRAQPRRRNSSANACDAVRPFYWEIGDASGRWRRAASASSGDPTVYTATTPMNIASASKWFYSTYFVQRTGGVAERHRRQVPQLQQRLHRASRPACPARRPCSECVDLRRQRHPLRRRPTASSPTAAATWRSTPALNGLGALDNAGARGRDPHARSAPTSASPTAQPQLAGGVVDDGGDYATLLRKILARRPEDARRARHPRRLHQPAHLRHARCRRPIPPGESWHYSIGHWVEDDPTVGDGAFSSAGAFGFYPWIDRDEDHYGVLARSTRRGAPTRSTAAA